MLERAIEGKVKSWAVSKGILPLKMTPRGVVGYPDDFFFESMGSRVGRPAHPPICIIEFKTEKGRVSPIQEVRIKEMRDRGYPVLVCRKVEDGIQFLREVFRIVD